MYRFSFLRYIFKNTGSAQKYALPVLALLAYE